MRTADPQDHDHHRDVVGGAARAAVFGVSDGLPTNVALTLGVAGAHPAAAVVRLAGLAGLIGGAFSMAAGEWVSMRAQAELLERELAVERRALAHAPDAERRELSAIYQRRGIDPQTASAMAEQVMADPEHALEVHAREELGVDPNRLGSPVAAASSSFVTFALGALVPLLPWLVASNSGRDGAVIASIILAAVGAIVVGAALATFTGRSVVRTAARQLGIIAAAAGVTYAIGAAVGVSG